MLGSGGQRWYKYVTVVQLSDLFEHYQQVLKSVTLCDPFPLSVAAQVVDSLQ